MEERSRRETILGGVLKEDTNSIIIPWSALAWSLANSVLSINMVSMSPECFATVKVSRIPFSSSTWQGMKKVHWIDSWGSEYKGLIMMATPLVIMRAHDVQDSVHYHSTGQCLLPTGQCSTYSTMFSTYLYCVLTRSHPDFGVVWERGYGSPGNVSDSSTSSRWDDRLTATPTVQ